MMFVLVERAKLKKMERRIMAKIDEYIASQKASMETLGTAVSGLTGDISTLTDKVSALETLLSQGSLTAEQEAALKDVTDQLGAVAASAMALDAKTPPNTPVEPPPPVVDPPPAEPTA
jgi:uncharacterized coiled-coil protein SlyX